VELDLPLLGTLKIVSALGFDVGVYLVVVGITLSLVRALGSPLQERES
jgi:multicomponent Na+:H+ antiporter subunit A